MRRPIAPIACILALLTGAWFGQAYALFAPIEPAQAEDTAAKNAVNTVWRFYDAIDILLRTADDSALHDVIAPGFVDHVDQPGAPSDRDGLVRYLTSLRDTHPALDLTPQDIVAQGDRVVARLAPTDGSGGAILGISLAGKDPWPRVDVVRVHEGQITERWGDPTGYAPATGLFSETLTFSHHGDLLPALRRVTVAPGAGDAAFVLKGPAIISIESGELDVTTEPGGAAVSASPLPGDAASLPRSTRMTTLTAGDAMPIADGVSFSAANRTASPTVFLYLKLIEPIPHYVPTWAAVTNPASANVTIEELTGPTLITPNPGRVSIDLARVTLAPGARLASHLVAGMEVVAVDAGTVVATIAGKPASAWVRDQAGRSVAPDPSEQLPAGFSLATAKSATTTYANESALAATVLVLIVTPG